MPAPNSYEDESELGAYMLSVLDAVGNDLTLSPTPTAAGDIGDFTNAVHDTLLIMGVDDVADLEGPANMIHLRAVAAVKAWELAKARASALYNFSDGSQRLEREKIYEHCTKQLQDAQAALASIPGAAPAASVARISSVRWTQDPYGAFDPTLGES